MRTLAALLESIGLLVALTAGGGCSSSDERPKPLADYYVTPDPPRPCVDAVPSSCRSDPDPATCESVRMEQCATDYYYESFEPFALGPCEAGTAAGMIHGQVLTHLFGGSGVLGVEVRSETHGLQRYFAPYELWFRAPAVAEKISMGPAIAGTDQQIQDALNAAGIPVTGDLTAEQQQQGQQIIAGILFAPIREFIRSRSQPPTHGVQVVILQQIVDPTLGKELIEDGEIAGLGLSPKLFADLAAADPETDLFKLIDIQGDFTPTLFIGHQTIARYTSHPDTIVAHEMGHALGLQHDPVNQGDLMYPYASIDCRPSLSQDEMDAMVGIEPLTGHLMMSHGWERLVRIHRAVSERCLRSR
jgi:hypothetical protein